MSVKMLGTLLPIARKDVERYCRVVNKKVIVPFLGQSNDESLLSEVTW